MTQKKDTVPAKSVKDLTPAVCENDAVGLFLDTVQFDQGFRAARLLAESKGLIPKEYEGSPGNCMLALNMAKSLGLSMQAFFNWTYPVKGRLGLEAKAIVTIANQSGMFVRGIEFEEIGSPEDGDEWGFKAFAEDRRYGTTIEEVFTLGDAKAAGWINNTWWQKLPRLMLKYRAASFLIKLNRPELLGGLDVFEELRDEAVNPYMKPSSIDITDAVDAESENNPPIEKPEPEEEELHPAVIELKTLFENPLYAEDFNKLDRQEIEYAINNNQAKSAAKLIEEAKIGG